MATLAHPETNADPLETFRQDVRSWLDANFPPSLKGKDNSMSAVDGPAELNAEEAAWKQAMADKGWGVPTWPREYGGGGLTRAEARVLG